MARLSSDDWAELRAEREASPRRGLTWLLASAGGRWDITEKAMRRKRLAEGWSKPQDLINTARLAHAQADVLSAARLATYGEEGRPRSRK